MKMRKKRRNRKMMMKIRKRRTRTKTKMTKKMKHYKKHCAFLLILFQTMVVIQSR
jgi:hypothetical protein